MGALTRMGSFFKGVGHGQEAAKQEVLPSWAEEQTSEHDLAEANAF